MTARPPDLSTAAAISTESVATTTGPTPAAWARRNACTIIGSPAISASGLPGNLVEAMRAGMRMRISAICASPRWLYGLQAAPQTGYLCTAHLSPAEPFSDEFVRNKQNSRCRAGNLPAPACRPYRLRRHLHAGGPGQARLRNRREGGAAGGRRRGAEGSADRAAPCQRLAAAGRAGRKSLPDLPQYGQGPGQ